MEAVDVIVVGGGPAGLSAGIVAANQGLRTLVLEQKTYPVDKACGEGVMPTGVEHLHRLGVAAHLHPEAYHPFTGIHYISAQGRQACADFKEGPGWGLRRTDLSRAFHDRAAELDCLEVRSEQRVTGIERRTGRIIARTGRGPISARLLVGADGLRSAIRRWSGLEGPPQKPQRWGARQHYAVAPWNDAVEIWWGDGIEAYVTPCAPDLTGIAFLWDRRRFRGLKGGKELIPSMLEPFPGLKERLRGAEPVGEPRTAGPLAQATTGIVLDGLVLAGDAAGYLDAITGDGISLATAEALALGETVFPVLSVRPPTAALIPAAELAGYEREYRRITRPNLRVTRLVLFLGSRPALLEPAVALLAHRPRLFQHLLSANLGLAPLWPGVLPALKLLGHGG